MRRYSLAFAFTVASTLTVSSSAIAQSPPRFSLDASAGQGVGWGRGEYLANRSGFAADVALSARLRPAFGGALAAGFSGSVQAMGSYSLVCILARDGGCVPPFPEFYLLASLIGWENQEAWLRGMIGPVYLQTTDGREHSMGVQGRLDIASRLLPRVAILVSFRPTLVPSHRGDVMALAAFGVGLRLR